MPKKNPHPQISHPTPPKMSDKHPRVQDPADSLSLFCSTRERLMIPPAPPRPWVKGISDNALLAQPLWGRKGFCGIGVLLTGQPCDGGEEASPGNALGVNHGGPGVVSHANPELSPWQSKG